MRSLLIHSLFFSLFLTLAFLDSSLSEEAETSTAALRLPTIFASDDDASASYDVTASVATYGVYRPLVYIGSSLSALRENELYIDIPSGNGESEANAVEVYIPVRTLEDNGVKNIFWNPSSLDDLPAMQNNTDAEFDTGTLNIRYFRRNFGVDHYIYAAAATKKEKTPGTSSYTILDSPENLFINYSNGSGDYDFFEFKLDLVELVDLCKKSDLKCTGAKFTVGLVIFLTASSDNSYSPSASIYSTDLEDENKVHSRLYFNLNFATSPSITTSPVIASITQGDARLSVNLSKAFSFTNTMVKALVFSSNGPRPDVTDVQDALSSSATADGLPLYGKLGRYALGGLKAGVDLEEETIDTAIEVVGLENEKTYHLAFSGVDKYGFSSLVSATQTGSTVALDTFIKEHNCYLLSAGFKRPHFVLDYFKKVRDEILLKNSFGKIIVSFYYKTAPSYAKVIAESDLLSFMVRTFAYLLYFVLNYFVFIFLSLFILGTFVYLFSRYKILKGGWYGRA